MIEEPRIEAAPRGLGNKRGRALDLVPLDGEAQPPPRLETGIGEFDRVAGGGLVQGSVLLVGGDPGIGKSTLLLQVAARLAQRAGCVYLSGEEAVDQLRLRAVRLGVSQTPVNLAAATSVRDIVATLDSTRSPGVVIADSIQTLYVDSVDSAPGTVTQVRASVQELARVAKRRGFVLLLVGHVTKEGTLAGPRVVEHMVDAVLYFEGDRSHQFRILRAIKNRFGATDEIGVFEMTETGLMEVANPSALFLAERHAQAAGCCVFAGIEGSRPVLLEVQALVAPSSYATPRRAVVSWDSARLAMVLAVMEARCGLAFGGQDVYLNIAGGLRINEPAADLAVVAALASSLANRPAPSDAIVVGEIGLAGEVRAVPRLGTRLREAAKLGFSRAFVPARRSGLTMASPSNLETTEISHVSDIVAAMGSNDASGRQREPLHG